MSDESYGTLEGGREILLTFDDGPHPTRTPRLLDMLAEHDIKAVFFVLGNRVDSEKGRAIVERAFADGHVIGNHTYSHPVLTKLPEEEVRDEIISTDKLISNFLGDHKVFRPPYGAHNAMVDRVVRDLGYHMMLWNADPEDWKKDNQPTGWIDQAIDRIKDRGDVTLLCHDIHDSTVSNFPTLLERLSEIPDVRFIEYS